jgi:hypothetical protein
MAAEYNRGMDSELDAVFRMLDDAVEEAKSIRVELDAPFLRGIAIIEALAGNQSGADKTWVHRLLHVSDRHFAAAIRKR